MFESEEFDLDEDFLKDIGEKEQEYYSQKQEPETTRLTKRRKTESIQLDFLSDISFDDEPDFARITIKSAEPVRETIPSENSSSRNESVPEIDESTIARSRNNKWETISVIEGEAKHSALSFESKSNENVKQLRRTLALEILRKGSSGLHEKSETGKNDDSRGTRPLSSINGERNSRVCDSVEQARRRTLLESFKKPAAVAPRLSKSPQKTRFSARDNRPGGSRVTTLVRKFPGPAGLLPDCPEPRLEDANYLEGLTDNVTETSKLENEDGSSEYFSQNTERLFTSGAWRVMLNDLPSDFLRDHEIATIKRTARNNSRIPLLAGVVQRIDHSLENPRLVLKDRTDQIEGTMHRDIPQAHPNVLEPGVVVLLRNVGILGFQASPNFPSLQFHVMIAPRNVVAVYSDKARLVTSPWMDSILGKFHGKPEMEDEDLRSNDAPEHLDRRLEETKSLKYSSTIEVERESVDPSDFESDNDAETFARFDLADLVDTSQLPASFFPNRKSIEPPGCSRDEDRKRKRSPASTTMKKEPSAERSSSDQEEKTEAIDVRPKKIASVRSRLAQFRNKDDPGPRKDANEATTSEEKEDDRKPMENSSRDEVDSKSTGFGDNLLESDNDTEDELLSQLDVDSIVTSYNST